jgi:hypothetical protein
LIFFESFLKGFSYREGKRQISLKTISIEII